MLTLMVQLSLAPMFPLIVESRLFFFFLTLMVGAQGTKLLHSLGPFQDQIRARAHSRHSVSGSCIFATWCSVT